MKKLLIVLLPVLFIFMHSCEEGEPGMVGPQGETGIPGKPGSVILSGQGSPEGGQGNEGDMYLDVAGSRLYGPKVANGWGTPLDLTGNTGAKGPKGDKGSKGDDGAAGPKGDKGNKGDKGDRGDDGEDGATGAPGAAGEDGTVIHSGNGTPPTSVGVTGDYYLNRENGDFYGPKSTTGWGSTPVNLSGTANVAGTTWIDVEWDVDEQWQKSFEYVVPSPVLNAVGIPSIKWLNDNGGVVLMYLRITQDSPVAELQDWQWQIPSMVNTYWDVDVRWSLLSGSPNLVAVSATETASNSYIALENVQFRYVVIPPGKTISAQARGVALDKLSYDQALQLFESK